MPAHLADKSSRIIFYRFIEWIKKAKNLNDLHDIAKEIYANQWPKNFDISEIYFILSTSNLENIVLIHDETNIFESIFRYKFTIFVPFGTLDKFDNLIFNIDSEYPLNYEFLNMYDKWMIF